MVSSGSEAPQLDAAKCAWFLDIDGTLVEIADAPDQVRIEPKLIEVVSRLARVSKGAVALISGRRIDEIDALLCPLHLPVAGQHGMERRNGAGSVSRHAPDMNKLAGIRNAVRDWASGRPGVLVEDKGFTLAVHFRHAPQLRDEVGRLLQTLVDEGGGDYCVQPGKMVFEIKPGGKDKGTAVIEFMDETPFRERTPVFIGDDATDEYAFAVVDRLGGVAVKVGAGESVARWRLPDVAAVHAWIRTSLDGERSHRRGSDENGNPAKP